jgi:signal transduction histidine kinase
MTQPLRILIVDDNKNNLVTLRSLLNASIQAEVLESQSALHALDLLMQHDVDLLILDVQMPDMDGFELAQLVRRRRKTEHIPIILLTAAYLSERYKQRGFEIGVEDYITKPINDTTLVNRIKAYLRPIQKERDLAEDLERKIEERTQELAAANARMRNEIDQRIRMEQELIQARDLAEQALMVRNQFLSVVSHELRTPLNAVLGMTYLLMQENPRPEQLSNLKTLKFSADNMLVLINDILDFNKIEAGMISLEEVDINLEELCSNIRSSLLPKAEEKNLTLNLDLDPHIPPALVGDPVRIGQIITNLVGNAIKFTGQGSVTLSLRHLEQNGQRARIAFSIQDTGIGIPTDKHNYIFESFTQASSDTTRKYGGTGLGLAITKRLLELQGSKIELISEPGQGSTFSFVLEMPLAARKPLPQSPPTPQELRGLEGLHVLMAEDNEINQLIAQKFFEKWGIHLDIAPDGKVAVEKARQNHYDLILLDLQMPEMDGYDAARNIRAFPDARFQSIPILALTASSLEDIESDIRAAGMNDLATKPFHPSELYAKLKTYIQPNA